MQHLDAKDANRPGVRRARMMMVVGVVSLLIVIAAVTPSPYVVLQPGPTVDVLGDTPGDDGPEPVIAVGAETYGTEGELRLVTVSLVGTPENRASWLTVARAWLDPKRTLVSLEREFPGNSTADERTEQNAALMDSSQTQAAAAAFAAMGEDVPTTLTVTGVSENGPSEGVLEVGDVILEVGGEEATNFPVLRDTISKVNAGDEVVVVVERDGRRISLGITPRVPDGGDAPMIGALLDSKYDLPHDVEFTLSDIGGPSAGLIFALGLTDLLTPGPLLEGLNVSGTGTIDSAGNVGPIDGLQQKLWAADRDGAELFLMPLGNCDQVPKRIPEDLTLVPVETLDEAIAAVEAAAGGTLQPGLERCGKTG